MDTQVGLELCTAGRMETMTVDGRCTICPGMMMIHSPLFPMLEISRSDDYRSVVLHDELENIYALFSQQIAAAPQVFSIRPFIGLSEERQAFFIHRVEQIRSKHLLLRDVLHPVQHRILQTTITLLTQETLLEFAFLFSAQMQDLNQPVSHKRQVLMSFLLSLNQEYRQQREVQYYAAKQVLTPRHFANIIKQESGYTPMEWINMVTINQAKNLLRRPGMLVKQVADELGFPEQFTFRKYFKSHTGLSPTEYQNKK